MFIDSVVIYLLVNGCHIEGIVDLERLDFVFQNVLRNIGIVKRIKVVVGQIEGDVRVWTLAISITISELDLWAVVNVIVIFSRYVSDQGIVTLFILYVIVLAH